jgi:PilZ domain
MRVPRGRTEKRSDWAVPVELSHLDPLLRVETTVAENVSSHGAKVVSKQLWKEGDWVLIKALTGDLQWRAQVVYCEILPSSTFAIGLKLLATADWWEEGFNGRATVGSNTTRKRRHKSQAPIIPFPRTRVYY